MVLRQHACGKFFSLEAPPACGSTVEVIFVNGNREAAKVFEIRGDELPGYLVYLDYADGECSPIRILRTTARGYGVA